MLFSCFYKTPFLCLYFSCITLKQLKGASLNDAITRITKRL
ncbi:hypothetical protein FM106_16465 [Brachybacterium faecium]|nr:hypothetical protein FM106_16465 [Brachybacterium faecium]